MFNLFSLNNAISLNENETKLVKHLIALYMKYSPRQGAFLCKLNIEDIKYKWDDNLSPTSGIRGAFTFLRSSSLFLMTNPNPPNEAQLKTSPATWSSWLFSIMDVVLHELTHMFQYQTFKLGYIICTFPVLKELMLEKGAKKVERDAFEFFEDLREAVDKVLYNRSSKHHKDEVVELPIDKEDFEELLNLLKNAK